MLLKPLKQEEKKMKKILLVLIAAMCVVGLAGNSWAATEDTISVSVELASVVSVSVTPNSWNIGPTTLSATSTQSCSAQNDGNVLIDLAARATNGANGWTLGNPAASDVFSVRYGASLYLTTSDQTCATAIGPSGTLPFDLTYEAPSGDSFGGGVSQAFLVTLTASASP